MPARVGSGIASAAALVAVALPGGSSDTVEKVSLTTPVRAGSYARLVVNVTPRARCTIQVSYGTGVSKVAGLGPKTGGRISWRWRVGADTRAGRWPIVVSCGKSGTLRLSITVNPPQAPPTPSPTPLPGRKVDVGGYGLYLECAGSGSPTVILESGSARPSATLRSDGWRTMRAALAAETRVCAYDRAGLGASDPRPFSLLAPTAATFANELRTLLTNANVPGPHVLYGESFGGLLISGYTVRYPSDVAGLVFSDALSPSAARVPGASGFEDWDAGADLDAFLRLHFGNRPVLVLTSTFFASEAPDILRRSSNSLLASAPGIGHGIAGEAPQLVAAAVRLVVAAVRTGARLPPCDQTPLPTVGGRCESLGP